MMKQTRVLAAVILAGAFLSGCILQGTNKGGEVKEEIKKEDEGSFAGSMMDLLKQGKPMTCEYGFEAEGVTQKGKIVTAEGKMRMDAEGVVEIEGQRQVTATHMIVDGEWQYLWTDQMKGTGTKIRMDKEALEKLQGQAAEEATKSGEGQSVDWNKKMSYKCGGWMMDGSRFTPPADVNFREIDMVKINQQVEDSKASVCKVCEQLSGEARTQCLNACKQ